MVGARGHSNADDDDAVLVVALTTRASLLTPHTPLTTVDHLLLLTGRLAAPALERVLTGMGTTEGASPFTWEVRELGVQVAALMTTDMVARRLPTPVPAHRVLLPGRCRGDVDALSAVLGVPVQRGPEELKDLPRFFAREAAPIALDDKGLDIFAEIVDAPHLTVEAIVERAREHMRDGADVIDLGCLPQTQFPHLEDSVRALKAQGFRVSVDSMNPAELLLGGRAGADYVLSLTADTAWVADEIASVPVLVAREPDDEASLVTLIEDFTRRGKPFLADSILDPIPFGFTASIARYLRLRERFPAVPIMVGVGNLTELTEADTSGINALLLGICAELDAAAILTTQVSPHARRAVREADHARRIMRAAVVHGVLPKGLSDALMTVHAKRPFPDTPDEIAAIAAQVRDPNFRVQVSERGLHVYNRDGLRAGTDPFALWPQLGLEGDAAHAFYMGVELARAQVAWQLGKRYVQDQPLDWGAAVEAVPEDNDAWCAPGTTLTHRHAKEPLGPANNPEPSVGTPTTTQPDNDA